jgi:hypothetical protein
LGEPQEPEVYYPELQERTEATYLVLPPRGDVDPIPAVRRAIAKFNPGVVLYDVRPMDWRVAESLRLRRFVASLLNGLAVTGMFLAIVDLYGSLARLVEIRRREIVIRIALGAQQSKIVRMLLARGGIVVASGLVVGSRSRYRRAGGTKAVVWRRAYRCGYLDRCAWRNCDGLGHLRLARHADRPRSSAALRHE